MENKQDEQVIFLKDLLFIALYKWRAVLTWAIVLAVLLGAGKGLLAFRDMRNDVLQQENAIQQEMEMEVYESRKASLQQQIDVNRENARQQQKYLTNSVLMNIDPYNHYEIYVSFFVDAGYQILPNMSEQNPDMTQPLISSYIEFFQSANNLSVLAAAVGTEPEYIPELISTETPTDARAFILKAKANDKASAEQMLQLMIQQINGAQSTIATAVADHTLNIKEQYVQLAINPELAQRQQEQVDKLTTLNDSIMNLQNQKSALTPPEVIVASGSAVVKQAIIFAVIGGLLGVFAVVVIAWFKHIAGSKVYSARTLNAQTGIKVLSCVELTPTANKADRKLRSLEGRNQMQQQVQTALSAATVCNLCANDNSLLIINDTDTDYASVLAQAVANTGAKLAVTCSGSLLADVSALEQLQQTDRVLLIAQCNASRYDDIRRQISLVNDHKKQLLGCILLNG